MTGRIRFLGVLLPIALLPLPAAAQVPVATVSRAVAAVTVDGALDEPDWASAADIGELRQREPREGEKASERTTVRLLYDEKNIYIGILCYDSDPDGIISTQLARDADIGADDRVEILLDTFRDRRNAYYFATNPAGVLIDGLIIENGRPNSQWDAIWTVRTSRFDSGWSAEFAIPFKSLSFRSGQETWGFNISRTIKRKIEESRWASPRLDVRFNQVSEAGEIRGLAGIEQGIGLDIRPYGSGKWLHAGDTADDSLSGKAGGDIFYNLTPSLKWTTTFNTDFAETEVDNRQINLTRFPLFFPEKRAFFLENAGAFAFGGSGGGRSPELVPFFSRRLGLAAGREVPILAGTRLTGKAGRFDIGLLNVQTRDTGDLEGKNFFVTRVKRNFWRQSYAGGIFTEGDPGQALSARTYGADLQLATSRFLGGNRNFSVESFLLRSDNEGVEGRDRSYGVGASYPNDLWDVNVDYRVTEENFRPALGFVSRTGVRKFSFNTDFAPRPKNFLSVRQMRHEFRYTRYTRIEDGRVESWRLFTAPANYSFNSGDRFEFNWVPTFERLFEPFEIADGVVLPEGDYRFTRWRLEYYTASKRPWEARVSWWFGTYYSGRSDQVDVSFEYKVGPRFGARLSLDQTFARLEEGNFVARIYGLRANYSVSPFLSFFTLVQYDNESRNLGWQSRVRWILRPGDEIFLVFSQGWIREETEERRFRATDRGMAVKLQYTFRF